MGRIRAVKRKDPKIPCSFCGRTVDDEFKYGVMYTIGSITCHYFCVLLSSRLVQRGKDSEGVLGFLFADIQKELIRARNVKCHFCKNGGASTTCCHSNCRLTFHIPCGVSNNCLSIFDGTYQSYCKLHRLRQKIPASVLCFKGVPRVELEKLPPKKKRTKRWLMNFQNRSKGVTKPSPKKLFMGSDVCCICYELVNFTDVDNIFWPVCCKANTLIHRYCLSRMAVSAGEHFIRCPLCNNQTTFVGALKKFGIYIPIQDASWERENGAFEELLERPDECIADVCQCPNGRKYKGSHRWGMRYCKSCGSEASHDECLNFIGQNDFECFRCVDVTSKMRQTVEESDDEIDIIDVDSPSPSIENDDTFIDHETIISVDSDDMTTECSKNTAENSIQSSSSLQLTGDSTGFDTKPISTLNVDAVSNEVNEPNDIEVLMESDVKKSNSNTEASTFFKNLLNGSHKKSKDTKKSHNSKAKNDLKPKLDSKKVYSFREKNKVTLELIRRNSDTYQYTLKYFFGASGANC